MFVLHIIGAIETVLAALLLLIACGTSVPIFHIKTTSVADILVCKILYSVGKIDALPLLCRLNPSQDVWDHVASHKRIGRHWNSSASTAMATLGMASAATTATTMSLTMLLVLQFESL